MAGTVTGVLVREKVGAWAAAAVAVLVTAGCSAADEVATGSPGMLPASASLVVNGMDLEPQLDESTGAVILPLDHFQPTWEENEILVTAGSVSLALCAREQGVAFLAPELSFDPIYLSENYYGPWTVVQAERFAFAVPMTDADLEENGITGGAGESDTDADSVAHPNFALTDEDWVTIDECGSSGAGRKFQKATLLDGPWTEQITAAQDALLESDEARALVDELGACFTSRGMEPDPDAPWLVRGANGWEISEQQVQLALGVVACRNEIGFTEKLARLQARATVPTIAEFVAELTEHRRVIDAAVEEGRALLAAHDDVVYHES